MTTCVTASDTFGADGKVVLLERGTKLVGETRGQVQQGQARLFVLWTQARTPAGVVVPLDSPGTDELGRAGVTGEVQRHFWQRFGAAMLISLMDGAVQAGVQSAASSSNGTVIYAPAGSQDVLTEVLKGTVQIAADDPVHNGERIQVLVARDIDFRPVYELRAHPRSLSLAAAAGASSSALDLTLRALRPLLANPEVTELCINRPRRDFCRDALRVVARGAAVRGSRLVPPARETRRQRHPAARG